MNKKINKAYFALFAATLAWGATIPIMKVALEHVPIFSLAFLRFGFASLILYPLVKNNLAVHKKDIPLIILVGFLGFTLHIPLFFFGLSNTKAINAGILFATVPLFSFAAASYVLREKISRNMIIGASIGFLGIVVITIQDLLQGISFYPLGDLMILLSTVAFALTDIVTKRLVKTYKSLTITFYSMFIGGLSFFPIALYDFVQNPDWISTLPLDAVAGILYGILFSSFSAYTLWQWGISKINVSRVSLFLYIQPVITTILAILLLGEKITPFFIAGAILIISGMIAANLKTSKR